MLMSTLFGVSMEFWAIIGSLIGIVIGGAIGVFSTLFISSKNINAELKAKTRLEWIREVRTLTAEIIKNLHELLILVDKYKEIRFSKGGLTKEEIFQFKVENAELDAELFKNLNMYKLYFSTITKDLNRYITNEENKKMHLHADKIEDQMLKLSREVLKNQDDLYDPRIIEDFRKETSDYIKKEWDRAKENN